MHFIALDSSSYHQIIKCEQGDQISLNMYNYMNIFPRGTHPYKILCINIIYAINYIGPKLRKIFIFTIFSTELSFGHIYYLALFVYYYCHFFSKCLVLSLVDVALEIVTDNSYLAEDTNLLHVLARKSDVFNRVERNMIWSIINLSKYL